jgi:hypothetical protein
VNTSERSFSESLKDLGRLFLFKKIEHPFGMLTGEVNEKENLGLE